MSKLVSYLSYKPSNLKEFLRDFLPDPLVETFDVEHYGWIPRLLSKESGSEGTLTTVIRIMHKPKHFRTKNKCFVLGCEFIPPKNKN